MKVTYYQRKPSEGHISIELLFEGIRQTLKPDLDAQVVVSRFPSQGFFKRLYNCLEAALNQGQVNHITGDVHYLAILLNKRKTILTIHDCGFMQHPNPLARWILLWFWLRLPVMRSRYVTVISETTRQDVLQYTACPPEKVRLIPNFVPATYQFCPKAFNERRPLLLQVGTKANKNIPRVAAALEGVNCELMIIGRPRQEDILALEQYSTTYQCKVNLSDEEMRQAYKACDVLLFASTSEGFGLPIIEAQAVGRPVLTSNCSSMPEVAGEGACLVDPYDSSQIREGIIKVIQDAAYRDHLIRAGRENVKRFHLEQVAEQYYTLYQEVIDQT